MSANDLAIRHLLLRLRPLTRALRAGAACQASAAARLDRPDLAGVCVTDQHVADLLDDLTALLDPGAAPDPGPSPLTPEEAVEEEALRREAADRGQCLPLDRLAQELGLSPHEQEALLFCAAAELDRSCERIIGYLLDDLRRPFPCAELLCHLTADSTADRLSRRHAVGRFGRLRRCRLVEPFGEITTELRTALRLGPGVLEFLTGAAPAALGLWADPAEVGAGRSDHPGLAAERDRLTRLGHDLAAGTVGVVGIWGRPAEAVAEAAAAVARAAGRPLRRLPDELAVAAPPDALREALLTVAVLDAVLLVSVDPMQSLQVQPVATQLPALLASCSLPTILTGAQPWRPAPLLTARAYAEVELVPAALSARRAMWEAALPGADRRRLDDLAGRFRFGPQEVEAAVRLASTQARLDSNGRAVRPEERLDAACALLARRRAGHLLTVVKPRRGPDDLILPPDLHLRVLEIARFTRVLPRVAESWGFGRLATGGSGLKALFTGDPGTGKTLAAEVVAALLAVPLLKVNVGQVVSKWVGETEKNLDEAFAEAEASHAVLFLDEADALCGRRGEVRHGTDRYANTEVSHLLQRLEEHDGLVILASNLKDHIDPAFLRRFQVILHFPRPAEADRLRLWRLAFPPEAPLGPQVELATLARLDMTGAAIVGAARTAALLAADAGAAAITMAHVVQGVARQYRRDGRVLTPSEFGPYAPLLREPS